MVYIVVRLEKGDIVEFKRMLLTLTITIISITTIMFGISYGWYAYSNAESTISGSTIKEAPTVIFSETEFMSTTKIIPILDEDRYRYASKNSFNIIVNQNLQDYQVGIEISLINIKMSEALKTTNYKYELLLNNLVVANGDFSNIGTSTTLKLLPMTVIKPTKYPQTYNYELYIWLSDDKTNQNNLMNQKFSAKININSAVKK